MRPDDEITCREFVELVTDYFEGALPVETLALTEEHLVMCDWCSTYAAQMRMTSEALRETEHPATDASADSHTDHGHEGEPHSHGPAPALLAALQARRGDGS
jgi:anti-sigma factor RsiW